MLPVGILLIITRSPTEEGAERRFEFPVGIDLPTGMQEKTAAIRLTLDSTEQGWLVMQEEVPEPFICQLLVPCLRDQGLKITSFG